MSRLSVLNFRASLRGIGKEMDKLMGGSVLDEAEGLAGAMRQAASSHAKSGKTQKSIRVIKRRGNRVTVAAGGDRYAVSSSLGRRRTDNQGRARRIWRLL